jgi:hypothetical protein
LRSGPWLPFLTLPVWPAGTSERIRNLWEVGLINLNPKGQLSVRTKSPLSRSVNNDVALTIAFQSKDEEADQKNRDLIAAFGRAYPEYRDAFAGLVFRAHERGGNRGFGTVDENQK